MRMGHTHKSQNKFRPKIIRLSWGKGRGSDYQSLIWDGYRAYGTLRRVAQEAFWRVDDTDFGVWSNSIQDEVV